MGESALILVRLGGVVDKASDGLLPKLAIDWREATFVFLAAWLAATDTTGILPKRMTERWESQSSSETEPASVCRLVKYLRVIPPTSRLSTPAIPHGPTRAPPAKMACLLPCPHWAARLD